MTSKDIAGLFIIVGFAFLAISAFVTLGFGPGLGIAGALLLVVGIGAKV